ncbi:ROK family protein [Robbsia sp. Bb-Pol-6]|uniref:ROK family protein n=1 Tax=Robbsia betulipollinis TaxID=2981849 RepID=A0ABT3ZNB2_9BURK|nr:ROK family protein [Robbsia betulipollinis]MCY0388029.1 ROK family protein [Robbsia betulipollinis]
MAKSQPASLNILAIDIGGTGLKAALIDAQGTLIGERLRTPTPYPCPPDVLIAALVTLCRELGDYDRVAIGFPGVVRDGRVLTAPHFKDEHWVGYPLETALSQAFGNRPARLVNDALMQGLAAIRGVGLELVLTLGTGAGTALFLNGQPTPHLELAHHPIRGRKSYNDYVGDVARKKIGRRRWNRRVLRTIAILDSLLHYDHLYIGGGNAARIDVCLPPEISTVSNDAGLEGGAALWRLAGPALTD